MCIESNSCRGWAVPVPISEFRRLHCSCESIDTVIRVLENGGLTLLRNFVAHGHRISITDTKMPAGVCGACHHIYDEKQSVECIGPCGEHYHLSCAKIDASEREFFIVDGHSVYKCHNCTRRGNNDMCVTPVASRHEVKAAESSLLLAQDKHVENNLECLVVDKLNTLKENGDSMLLQMKELLNGMERISADLSLLRSDNVALKSLLTEFLEQNEARSCVKPSNMISLTECIQSSSKTGNNCTDEPLQNTLAAEDVCFKITHKRIRLQRSEFSSPISKSAEKIPKIEAHFNSGVSASVQNSKLMKVLPDVKADEQLLKKMTVSRTFPWKTANFLLLLVIVGLVAYDIRKHGSFQSSSTGRFLNDIGALQYGEHAWAKTKFYSNKSFRWAEENIPHYYKTFGDHAKPYLELAWDVCLIVGHQLHNMYGNIHAYVEEKAPTVIEWIDFYAPWLLDKVKVHSAEAWELVKQNALILWQFFLHYSDMGMEWLKTNVFVGNLSPENLQKYSMEALNTTQVYAAWTYDWVRQKVQTLSKIQ